MRILGSRGGWRLLTLGVAIGWAGAAPAAAPIESLKPQGFVNDFAQVLSPAQRARLEEQVRALQTRRGTELAIVILESLQGRQIEDVANKLFKSWGVGQKGRDNGVLLLVAMNERAMRIEVGYGLEPVLPDILAGRIIDNDLRPRFQRVGTPMDLVKRYRVLPRSLKGAMSRRSQA